MKCLYRVSNNRVILKAGQFLVILEKSLLPVLSMNNIHRDDPILGNSQPLFTDIAVLVDLDGLLQRQVLPDFLLRGIGVRHDIPSISVGKAGICGIPEGLFSGLSQPIVTGAAGIFLTGKVQQDIIYGLFQFWIICQGLTAEASRVTVGQFLPDALEKCRGICELLLFAVGVGCSAHQPVLLSHLLLAQIIAIQIPLILTREGRTAQAEAVIFCFCDIAITSAVFRDGSAMLPAVGIHSAQILQESGLTQVVYQSL